MSTKLYDIYCADLTTGEITLAADSNSYPWRDLAHQMDMVAAMNQEHKNSKLVYFVKEKMVNNSHERY
jgi:hypothetical protein